MVQMDRSTRSICKTPLRLRMSLHRLFLVLLEMDKMGKVNVLPAERSIPRHVAFQSPLAEFVVRLADLTLSDTPMRVNFFLRCY